jgi:phosphate transport system substrate-binding protein
LNAKHTILIAIAAIAIIIGSVAAYTYVGANSMQPSPTPTPTVSPTSNPTAAPTNSPTTSPTARPTAHPTANPTTTPTIAPTATPSPTPTPVPVPASLTGAGATFPYPLLNAMITDYTTAKPYIQVNYQSIGSGGGISAMQQKTVDFGASDAPLSATEMNNIPNALHIPETIGAVTVTYNLPGIATGLHLTGQVIADIYQGIITMWNDPAIQNLNPTITLPAKTIVVVHRSDSSGTSFVFTGYLSASSSAWSAAVGQGKAVAWPTGLGGSGNAGVAGTVEGTAYTIGYVELAYSIENTMKVAAVQNPTGNWIMPTLASTTAAAQAVASSGLPSGGASWTSVNILNAPASNAYPIVSFSYIIVYKELNVIPGMTQSDATALVQFLWYVVHNGQNQAPALSYASLPSNVVQIDETTIQSITFNGQTLPTT